MNYTRISASLYIRPFASNYELESDTKRCLFTVHLSLLLKITPHFLTGTVLTARAGGKDCLSFSTFSGSVTFKVYKYLLQRTLNFVTPLDFLIETDFASFRRAVKRKSLISLICFGIFETMSDAGDKKAYIFRCITSLMIERLYVHIHYPDSKVTQHLFHEASLSITISILLGVQLIHQAWLVSGS